jgi:hypothetical protein
VVSGREYVAAAGEEPVGEARREPGAVGRVLAVDDAEVDLELVPKRRQPFLDRAAARGAEDVRDEEEPQGTAGAAAVCTSTATWLP